MPTSAPSGHPDGESYDDLHQRVLAFLGAFTSMQFAMDAALDLYLRKQLPALGPILGKQFLTKMRDDQRLPCFLAFARDSGYSRDLTLVGRIYGRAKATRDLVGHSHHVGMMHGEGGVRSVGVLAYERTSRRDVPEPLLPSTFDRLRNDCEWLSQHAMRALYEANAADFLDFSGGPSEPPTPPNVPNGGEPL